MSKYDAAIGTLEMERTRILRELSDVDSALAIMRKLRIRDEAATPGAWTTGGTITGRIPASHISPSFAATLTDYVTGDDKLSQSIAANVADVQASVIAIPGIIPKEPTEEML